MDLLAGLCKVFNAVSEMRQDDRNRRLIDMAAEDLPPGGEAELWQRMKGEIRFGAQINGYIGGVTAFTEACRLGRTQLMENMLAMGADKNTPIRTSYIDDPNTPWLLAARSSQPEALRVLLKHGVDPKQENFDDEDAMRMVLRSAAKAGESGDADLQKRCKECYDLLSQNGLALSPKARGRVFGKEVYGFLDPTAKLDMEFLTEAHQSQNAERLVELLKQNANVNAGDQYGKPTALIVAAAYNDIETMQLLLKNGANVNLVSDHYEPVYFGSGPEVPQRLTPLQVAVKERQEDAIRLLLRYGADPDANKRPDNKDGVPAIIAYANRLFTDTKIQDLIRKELKDRDGSSPAAAATPATSVALKAMS